MTNKAAESNDGPTASSRKPRARNGVDMASGRGLESLRVDPWLDYLADLLTRKFLREMAERSA